MNKIIIIVIVIILIGASVFAVYKYLMINIKDSIVDCKSYLGNRNNPANIYKVSSNGYFYSPMNIDIIPMDKLMLIDIKDDSEYKSIELQTFDDSRGKGARVLLYRHEDTVEYYFSDEVFVMKESEEDQFYIDPEMEYHFEVTNSGLIASLTMRDLNGKQIEFQVKETLHKKWSKGFLAPVGGSKAIKFPHFPFFFMKDMNFVLRKGTEINIKIGGEKRQPERLPIPVNMEMVYLCRYTDNPIIACWNRPFDGRLYHTQMNGQSKYKEQNTIYELSNNKGHYEIYKMLGFNEKNKAYIEFSPPVPDLVCLNDGTDIKGRFCAGVDNVPGIIAGIYKINRQGNSIDMEIRPEKGWQPLPGKLWVKTWIWKSKIKIAPDNIVAMKSGWIKE